MKRKISVVIALSIIMTTFSVPDYVNAETVNFRDYTPVTIPDNLMTAPQKGDVFGNVNVSDGSITKSYNNNSNWKNEYNAYEGYFIEAVKDTAANAAYYSKLAGIVTTDGAGGLKGKTLTEGKSYVLSFLVRNAGNTDSANINFGLGNTNTWASCVYSNEKGEAGYSVTDKTEWTKVAGTLTAPSATPYLSIGFPAGTPTGTKVEVNLSYLPDEAIYFAEETAYELNVSCENTELYVGETVNVSAELLNQIGTTGSLSQDFDWYVVNEDRTEQVDGFSINPSEATAEITVGDSVEPGNYVIVAVSDGNDMAKGIEILVKEVPVGDDTEDDSDENVDFNDYAPIAKPDNIITDPQKGEVFGNINSNVTKAFNTNSAWDSTYGTYQGYIFAADSTVASQGGAYANVGGFTTTNTAGGLKGKSLEANKPYVISFLARNIGTTDSFKVNMGLTNSDGNWAPTYTLEKGEEGYTVTDKENWTKIAGTIIAPCVSPFLSAGFMNGEAAGSKMEINLAYDSENAIYMAEEVAYELKVNCEDTELDNGDMVNVSVELLNQVGTTGSLSQKFGWYVVNEDRTEQVDGFSINASSDSAEITVGDAVETGNYVIVAVSKKNNMAKGIRISVGDVSGGADDGDGGGTGDDTGDGEDDGTDDNEPGDYSDSYLEIPANIMINPTRGEVFGNENSSGGTVKKMHNADSWDTTHNGYRGYFIDAVSDVVSQGAAYANVAGVTLTETTNACGLYNKKLVAGKSYVLSYNARNVGTTDSFNVNFGLTDTSTWKASYPIEYGEEGFTVSKKEEWTTVSGTIIAPQQSPFLSIGFVDGTEQGSKMEFNLCYDTKTAIYFAEEIPYIMEVIYDGEELVDADSTILFETKVTNQIGSTGNLKQDAKYYVVNEARDMKVSGFSFTDEDGRKRMSISKTVEPGTYYVIAENLDNPQVRKGVKIQVQRIYQSDFVPEDTASAGEVHDIEVVIEQGKTNYSFLDSLKVSAAVLDINDNEVAGAQDFEWKAYKENRRDEEENIIITQSSDTKTAEVSFKSSVENGTYYILARAVNDLCPEEMQRVVKIVVDNHSAYAMISSEINGADKTSIKNKLETYAQYTDIPEEIYSLVDKDALSQVIEKTEFSADDIKEKMLAACIVSLYVSNPLNVELNSSEDLTFVYSDELGISYSAQSDITLIKLYSESLSHAQKTNVLNTIKSIGVVSVNTFIEKLYESIILEGVKSSQTSLGTGYVLDFITEANLSAANINKGKLNSENAKSYASQIGGKTLTKHELEKILSSEISSSNGNGGGSSSGGSASASGASGSISSSGVKKPTFSSGVVVGQTTFSDVDESHWAFKQIDFLKRQNIISGKDGNNFCPGDYLKREELTKIIVEAFKLTDTKNALSFNDVIEGAWYEEYIKIASSNGIINGISETSFGVGENITRQDLCVMITRVLGKDGVQGAEMPFTDKDEISTYAVSAVSYLNMLCVINGYEDNTFRPRALCTRAEAAKIIGDILNYEVKEIE